MEIKIHKLSSQPYKYARSRIVAIYQSTDITQILLIINIQKRFCRRTVKKAEQEE